MPFVLIIAGVILLVSAVRNTQQQLFYLLASDFTGPHNFIFWMLSILLIGALGYIPKAKPLSDGFLILVILVLFLRKNKGFFDMFQKQISVTETSSPQISANATTANQTIVSGGGGGGGVTVGSAGGGSGITVGIGVGGIGVGIGGQSPCSPFDPFCGVGGIGSGGAGIPGQHPGGSFGRSDYGDPWAGVIGF